MPDAYRGDVLAVAFLPHPPALLPGLTGGPVPELATMRSATYAALTAVLATGPETVLVLGSADTGHVRGLPGVGGPARAMPGGPLSVAVADVLLDDAGWAGPRRRLVLPADPTDDDCAGIGAAIGGGTALLVMGDGSACRHPDAPGGRHPGAVAADDAVAEALAAGDVAALAALDGELGVEVRAAGTGVWRAVGQALGTWSVEEPTLTYYGVPFGVAYLVARWNVTPEQATGQTAPGRVPS